MPKNDILYIFIFILITYLIYKLYTNRDSIYRFIKDDHSVIVGNMNPRSLKWYDTSESIIKHTKLVKI